MTDPTRNKTTSEMNYQDPDRATKQRPGLPYWMERVLEEVDGACRELSADRVHDLRVALRRCRSMTKGFMTLDPDKNWNALQKESRRLFRRLGKLRDVQVLQEWTGRLSEPGDAVSVTMLLHLDRTEQELKTSALAAVQAFDRDKWRNWVRRLRARARRVPVGGAVFQLTALQAWDQAHRYHRQALRDRTPAAWHRLRIGMKRFRYTVENFLPLRHAEWGRDLKEIQDCLGEAHDLFVFRQTATRLRAFPDPEMRERWRVRIAVEQAKRIDRYREKMVGNRPLWSVWRQGLPPESRLPSMSLRMIEKWASFHRIDLARARRVRSLALQLHNGLRCGKAADVKNWRAILHLAAILHELGRGKGNKRESVAALLLRLPSVPGFTAESLLCAAMVILGHGGKFWAPEDKEYAVLSEAQRRVVMELCGILRLARVLALKSGQKIGPLEVEQTVDSIVVLARGYTELGSLAEKAARARYLLECARRRPVIIRNVPDNGHADGSANQSVLPNIVTHFEQQTGLQD